MSGLTSVKARVTVQWDMAITMRGGATLSGFERDVRSAFERGFTGTDVRVDETAPAHLDCLVRLRYIEDADGTVVLSHTVRLSRADDPEGRLSPWAVAWSRGERRVTNRDALSGSEVDRDCAADFERDFRRANPTRSLPDPAAPLGARRSGQ